MDNMEQILPSIRLHKFPDIYTFNKDGVIIPFNSSGVAVTRKAFLTCPTCMCLDDFYAVQSYHFEMMWCPGGKAPTHDFTNPMTGKTETHTVSCSAFSDPHFHVRCVVCHNDFFVDTPGAQWHKL